LRAAATPGIAARRLADTRSGVCVHNIVPAAAALSLWTWCLIPQPTREPKRRCQPQQPARTGTISCDGPAP
jgi:hypothetical protein